jgi:hypothetical protein
VINNKTLTESDVTAAPPMRVPFAEHVIPEAESVGWTDQGQAVSIRSGELMRIKGDGSYLTQRGELIRYKAD